LMAFGAKGLVRCRTRGRNPVLISRKWRGGTSRCGSIEFMVSMDIKGGARTEGVKKADEGRNALCGFQQPKS